MPQVTDENSKVNKAPSAAAAAQQFMDLSQEYLELVPVLRRQTWPIGDSAKARTTKRVAALAIAMQRKFVTRGENTYIPGLLTRITTEHKADIPRDLLGEIKDFSAALSPALQELHDVAGQRMSPDGSVSPLAELAPMIRYGRLLHSDYEKWLEAGEAPWLGMSTSVLLAQSKFRKYLRMTRLGLEELHDAGVLPDLDFVATEDIHQDRWKPDGSPED